MALALLQPYLIKGVAMIDSNLAQYVKAHQERIRRLEELYEKISSPEYNDEEKKNFRQQSLELCLGGLATV